VQDRFMSIFRPHGELDSNQHRVVTMSTGIEMIKAHPIFGIGPERVGAHVEQYAPSWIKRPFPEGYYGHLHNIYIHYAAERGLPALLFLIGVFVVVLRNQQQALQTLAPGRGLDRAIHQGVNAAVIAIMAGGFFEYNLGDSEILTMFLVVVAAGYSSSESNQLAVSAS
jgi:O-antigen ligase